jgi:hypothetical protein
MPEGGWDVAEGADGHGMRCAGVASIVVVEEGACSIRSRGQLENR